MLKTKIILLFTIISSLLLTGCSNSILPERTEIDDLMIIRAIGIDKAKDEDKICVTIISKEVSSGQTQKGGGGGTERCITLTNEASTVFEAERQFQTHSEKKMFFGHVGFYLISEEAAREGVIKYIDFLIRDHEMRINSSVYIIKGSTAKDFIEKTSTGEYFMPDRLKAIGVNSKLVTGPKELLLSDFAHWLINYNSCVVAPTIQLKPKDKEHEEGKAPPMDIDLYGYAVFKDFKLAEFVDKKMTRGENFILNRVEEGVIEVKDPKGDMVGLEIIDSKTKIEPVFEKKELKQINIKVKLSSNLDEAHSTSMKFNEDFMEHLSNAQSKAVKGEIEKVISFAQEKNTDFIDIADVIEEKHPVKWLKYRDKWDEVFPKLQIKVEVESKINRTYDVHDPYAGRKERNQ